MQFHKASPGSGEKLEAQKQLNNEISQRKRIDNIMNQIGKLLFGTYENGSKVMNNVKPAGQPLVDDWDCFKMHVSTTSTPTNNHIYIYIFIYTYIYLY